MNAAMYNEELMLSRLSRLGSDLGDVAKMKSPVLSIEALMGYLGDTFQCDRVYLFEKNKDGNYDCTGEWCGKGIFSKRHLLQNIRPKTVRYYYNYFLRDSKLVIRNMEQFKQEDYHLYRMLNSQNLSSLVCHQLVYDDRDMGFIGVDNPCAERFDELLAVFEIISYFVSVQIHKKSIYAKIQNESRSVHHARNERQYSLYNRGAILRMEEPLSIVYYHLTTWNRNRRSQEADLGADLGAAVGDMLSGIYGAENVFSVGDHEFLTLLDGEKAGQVGHCVLLSRKALEEMGIYVCVGVVETDRYEENLFELINIANANMLRERRQYQEQMLSKYHMGEGTAKFLDLVEIHPKSNYYRVLFSGYAHQKKTDGKLNEMLEMLEKMVHEQDRERFRRFWNVNDLVKRFSEDSKEYSVSESFLIKNADHGLVRIFISIVAYQDVDNEPVLLCYTK